VRHSSNLRGVAQHYFNTRLRKPPPLPRPLMFELKTTLLLAKLFPHLQATLAASSLTEEEKVRGEKLATELLLLLRKASKGDAAPLQEQHKSRPRKRNRLLTQFLASVLRETA